MLEEAKWTSYVTKWTESEDYDIIHCILITCKFSSDNHTKTKKKQKSELNVRKTVAVGSVLRKDSKEAIEETCLLNNILKSNICLVQYINPLKLCKFT